MPRRRHTEEQILQALRQAESGAKAVVRQGSGCGLTSQSAGTTSHIHSTHIQRTPHCSNCWVALSSHGGFRAGGRELAGGTQPGGFAQHPRIMQ